MMAAMSGIFCASLAYVHKHIVLDIDDTVGESQGGQVGASKEGCLNDIIPPASR